jgi:hypothetical protein
MEHYQERYPYNLNNNHVSYNSLPGNFQSLNSNDNTGNSIKRSAKNLGMTGNVIPNTQNIHYNSNGSQNFNFSNLTSNKKMKASATSFTDADGNTRSFLKGQNSTFLNQSLIPDFPEDMSLLNEYKRVKRFDDQPLKFEKDAQYFLACYDPEVKELYFTDFITENIIRIENYTLTPDIEEKVNKLNSIFQERWDLIKKLSKLEDDNFLSNQSKKYLRRPMLSKFLFPEKLELNNFNSCYPLPAAFREYSMIDINITIHETVCKLPEADRVIKKKVGFYYV